MKTMNQLGIVTAFSAIALLAACDVDVEKRGKAPDVDVSGEPGQLPKYEVNKTQEGKLPDVNVDVEPGRMPEYDVRGPDVDLGTKKVEVPTLDVDMPKENAPKQNAQ